MENQIWKFTFVQPLSERPKIVRFSHLNHVLVVVCKLEEKLPGINYSVRVLGIQHGDK